MEKKNSNSQAQTRAIASRDQIPYYNRDVDFDELARRDAAWARIWHDAKKARWIDFHNPKLVLQLTNTLLAHDFNLAPLSLPPDRLCPPVPVRWNYVRWMQELLDTTTAGCHSINDSDDEFYDDAYDPARVVRGLDIGTGASAIYPLLACSTRPAWRMTGTDMDAYSLGYAQRNVKVNAGLEGRVSLVQTDENGPLLPLDAAELASAQPLDFIMTNPPFYGSKAEMEEARRGKEDAPLATCSGGPDEMLCDGGDAGFVERIVRESEVLGTRVQWYSAMLGKFESLRTVVTGLRKRDIGNFAVASLQAGHRTNRWAVAWSFGDARPRNDVARAGRLIQAVLPPATAQSIGVPLMTAAWAGRRVDEVVRGLEEVQWRWRAEKVEGVMWSKGNVWSRAARRKKKFGAGNGEAEEMEVDGEEKIALAVKITCKEGKVNVRWLRGLDFVLFESFCGMLKRALTTPG